LYRTARTTPLSGTFWPASSHVALASRSCRPWCRAPSSFQRATTRSRAWMTGVTRVIPRRVGRRAQTC